MAVSQLWARLGLNNSAFINGLNQAARAADRFSATVANRVTRKVTSPFNSASQAVNNFSTVSSKGLRDVSRIVQGIMISQFFYRTINGAQNAAAAIFEMSQAVENANIAFTVMFKNQDKARSYIRVIEDFAAVTPYSFNQAAEAAKKLLAMGVKAENSMYVLKAITDASVMSGDPESLNRIAKAIGQINTKGKLAQQELLQLTEAGIPAFEILQQKLGLTKDQLGEIGKQNIPADVAIKALIDGMNDRYGGASDLMSKTMTGMISTIKDSLLLIAKDAFDPFYQRLHGTVEKVASTLSKLRDIVRKGGIGAAFEAMFPPSTQAAIRQFIAYLQIFKAQVGAIFKSLLPFIKQFADMLLITLNAVAPVILTLNSVIVFFMQSVAQSTPLVKGLVTAIGALLIASTVVRVITGLTAALKGLFIVKIITSAVLGLAQAMRVLVLAMISNPWALLLGVLAAGLVAVAFNSDRVRNSLNGLTVSFSKAFGADPSKIFAPKQQDNIDKTAEFNKELTTSGKKIDDMGDKAKKAGKKAKEALMSFDEVFNLKEDKDDGSDVDAGEIEVPSVPIPEIDTSGFQIPSFEEMGSQIAAMFKGALFDKFKSAAIGTGLGALIGAIIGGLIGGPGGALIGAKIGAVAGAIVGWFWEDVKKFFQSSTGIGAGVGAGIGGVIGFAFGGPLGAGIGAALGAVLGGVVGRFWEDIKKFFTSSTGIGGSIGASVGGIIGFIFGGPLGAALGAGLGGVIGGTIGHFLNDIVAACNSVISYLTGTFGISWSGAWDGIKRSLEGWLTWINGVWTGLFQVIGGVIDFLVGVFTADWGKAWDGLKGIVGGFVTAIDGIWEGLKDIIGGMLDFLESIFGPTFGAAFDGLRLIVESFITVIDGYWQGLKDVINGIITVLEGVFTGNWSKVWDGVLQIFYGFVKRIMGVIDGLIMAVDGIWMFVDGVFTGLWGKAWTTIKQLFQAPIEGIKGILNGLKQAFNGIVDFIAGVFTGNWRRAWNGVLDIFKGIFNALSAFVKTPINGIIDAINVAIGGLNRMSFDVPDWVPVIGGQTWGFDIPKIPRLAKGGLVTKNTLAEIGEGNKKEAVIPLENGNALEMIAERIVNKMNVMQPAYAGAGGADERQILYVGTLIADDRSLRELERKMQVIRLKETVRRG